MLKLETGSKALTRDPTRPGQNRWPGDPVTRDPETRFHLCPEEASTGKLPVPGEFITTCRSALGRAWVTTDRIVKSMMPCWPARSSVQTKLYEGHSSQLGNHSGIGVKRTGQTLTSSQLQLSRIPPRHLIWVHMRQLAGQTVSHRCAVKKLCETMPGGVRSSDWLPPVPYLPILQDGTRLLGR